MLIGILDTGIDPGIPGLGTTSTGGPKILDLRDFSGEGRSRSQRVTPAGDSVRVGGPALGGFGRVPRSTRRARTTPASSRSSRWASRPRPTSMATAGGRHAALVVTRASDGWVMFADTDGDGSLAGERPVHDYLAGARDVRLGPAGPQAAASPSRPTSASDGGAPTLDLFFDTSGHGTHVAGIAAGHDLYGVTGFDGVAPGAQLLGLKIANSAQGSITTTGSMLRAMDYAIRFAEARRLPLVLNMSFGVGNEIEGQARIDALVDSVLAAHPDVVLTDQRGQRRSRALDHRIPRLGQPRDQRRRHAAGQLPRAGPSGAPLADQLAYFSSRGGELAKPDIVTPGVAYSTVPRWNAGEEIEQGTSMASPHAAGLAALLVSAWCRRSGRSMPGDQAGADGDGPADAREHVRRRGHRAARRRARPTAGSSGGHPFPRSRCAPSAPGDVTAAIRSGAGAARGHGAAVRAAAPAAAPRRPTRSGATHPGSPRRPRSRSRARERGAAEVRSRPRSPSPVRHVGTVTGWSADSLAGPVFRLVTTLVSPRRSPPAPRAPPACAVQAGRRCSEPSSGRQRPSVRGPGRDQRPAERALAFLHEPDGMPYRDESARPAGSAAAAVYEVDGARRRGGAYEGRGGAARPAASVDVSVTQSPLIAARREPGRVASAPRSRT